MQSDDHDTKYPEFYSNIAYKNIEDALEVFKTDDLLCEPGEIVCWCFIHKIYYYYFILYTETLTWWQVIRKMMFYDESSDRPNFRFGWSSAELSDKEKAQKFLTKIRAQVPEFQQLFAWFVFSDL